jgi:inner membrane protein involved in colicin E2 resistance
MSLYISKEAVANLAKNSLKAVVIVITVLVVLLIAVVVRETVIKNRLKHAQSALDSLVQQNIMRRPIGVHLPKFGNIVTKIVANNDDGKITTETVNELVTVSYLDTNPEFSLETVDASEFVLAKRKYLDLIVNVQISLDSVPGNKLIHMPLKDELQYEKITDLKVVGILDNNEEIPYNVEAIVRAVSDGSWENEVVAIPVPEVLQNKKHRVKISYQEKGANSIDFHEGGFPVNLKTSLERLSFKGVDRTSDSGDSYQFTVGAYAKSKNSSSLIRSIDADLDYVEVEPKKTSSVEFLATTGDITKVDRVTKFASLVILLVFAAVFFVDLKKGFSANILQYSLIGISLVLFYLLVLAIGEYTGFNVAYLIGSLVTLAINGWYTSNIFNSSRSGLITTAVIGFVYLLVFVVISLTSTSFITAVIILYAFLMLFMYATSRMNKD